MASGAAAAAAAAAGDCAPEGRQWKSGRKQPIGSNVCRTEERLCDQAKKGGCSVWHDMVDEKYVIGMGHGTSYDTRELFTITYVIPMPISAATGEVPDPQQWRMTNMLLKRRVKPLKVYDPGDSQSLEGHIRASLQRIPMRKRSRGYAAPDVHTMRRIVWGGIPEISAFAHGAKKCICIIDQNGTTLAEFGKKDIRTKEYWM